MSTILRRPMFRGGSVSSDGTGITSGLNDGYESGGRVGYQKAGYVNDSSFAKRFKDAMERTNANEQARWDSLKSDKSYDLANIFSNTTEDSDFNYLRDTGLGRFIPKFNEYAVKEPLAAVYNLVGVPLNKASEFVTGYNPGFSGERFFNLDMKDRKPDTAAFFGIDTSAKPGMTYINEKIKAQEAKLAAEKINAEKIKEYGDEAKKEEIAKRKELPTLGEDIDTYSKLLMENAGPDKDEYTRQKYLTLAKFGLNLLKPTPAGVPTNFLTSVAAAAEKPLEEYANISMQESKEGKALKQLAAQMAFQKHMPGPIAKTVQDIMTSDPSISLEDATSRALTGKSLVQLHKEERVSIAETAKRLADNPNLKGLSEKDPASLQLFAKLVEKGVDDTQLKGPIEKYNYPIENSYYTNVLNPKTNQKEVAHYYKGQFHFRGEPNFFVKQKGI